MHVSSFLHFLITGEPFSPGEIDDVKREMSFIEAIESHAAWRSRLLDAMRRGSIHGHLAHEVGDDGGCALGSWILGAGYRRYGHLSSFDQLRRHHSTFHRLAREIAQHSSRQPALAKELWPEFDDSSQKMIGQLGRFCRVFHG